MLIDNRGKKISAETDHSVYSNLPIDQTTSNDGASHKKIIYISFAAFSIFLLIIIGAVSFIFYQKNKLNKSNSEAVTVPSDQTATTSEFYGNLPGDLANTNNNGNNQSMDLSNIRAEDLTFGFFYEPINDDFVPEIEDYDLPLNVKTDVSNYYLASRKINLDPYISDLNNNGFAMMSSNVPKEANDFYSSYRYLANRDLPIVLTSDFLLYYYQNTLKQIYKEVEKTAFYENIWDISNNLYQISLMRYKKRREEMGIKNDPLLEAERLECAYFATALKLLSPTRDQLNTGEKAKSENLFDEQEAVKYYYELPDFLRDDVESELALIKEMKLKKKSPVLLYERNYKDFIVPGEYASNAKLKNYYLAMKWLNSLWPLYYQSDECPDCLLDFDDWKINFLAANLIASDLASSQEFKNKWAVVYKFIAFFSGLRQDLTYLNYRQAFTSVFGGDDKIEDIFNETVDDEQYVAAQNEIANFTFLDMEGGIVRDETNVNKIGFKILQDPYWPNDYIFSNLTGEEIISYNKSKERSTTACRGLSTGSAMRCNGFSYDIINLLHPDPTSIDSAYYIANTDYENYDTYLDSLKSQIDMFDTNTWNSNVFWITLDLGRLLLNYDGNFSPTYEKSLAWQNEKNVNTVLGGWVNINLPSEYIYDYYEQGANRTTTFPECNLLSYIEPNYNLVNELMAKNEMLIKMFNSLSIAKQTNVAAVELRNINSKFNQILNIMKKELSSEELEQNECNLIYDFTVRYAAQKSAKDFAIINKNKEITESIKGIKFLGLVYNKADKKVLGFGPVFNFAETID